MSFFKPKPSTSSASNVNNSLVTGIETPVAQQGAGAVGNISSLLTGTGDVAGAQGDYQNYLKNAGYQNALMQGERGITGQGAASGLLRSGTTAKALTNFGGQLDQQYFNNYLQNLSGLANLGQGAAGTIANVGQVSSSQGGAPSLFSSIAGGIGQIGQAVGTAATFSDRRLKTDITKIDEFPDGLGIYEFRYLGHPKKSVGVMADEVEKIRPWALGPVVDGFATVNYEAL